MRLLQIDIPAFPSQENVHAPIAVAHACLADIPDPQFQFGLPGATGLVMVCGRVTQKDAAGSPDRHAPLAAHLINELALTGRPQSFRRSASCSIALSSARSATTFFSFAFSSSSCFSRRISSGNSPSYFFFQLKYVAWLIPALRQSSATGIPSLPCFKMNAFCASENFDAFIVFRSSPASGSHRKTLPKNDPVFWDQTSN